MPSTPATQLTLRWLRAADYHATVVEHWNPAVKRRVDLFGIIDVLALKGPETLAVQCTAVGDIASRVTKIGDSEAIPWLREANWGVWVVGWGKVCKKCRSRSDSEAHVKKCGGRVWVWEPKWVDCS